MIRDFNNSDMKYTKYTFLLDLELQLAVHKLINQKSKSFHNFQ